MSKLVAILLTVIIFVTACGVGDSDFELSVTPREVYEHLEASGFFEPPFMQDIDADKLGDFRINPDDAVSFIAREAAISAIFIQIILIEATPGRVNAVYADMLEHQTNLQDATAYPQGTRAAMASIVGTRGNLVYLICDERAQDIESEILRFIT
jgi:hypothetical protein